MFPWPGPVPPASQDVHQLLSPTNPCKKALLLHNSRFKHEGIGRCLLCVAEREVHVCVIFSTLQVGAVQPPAQGEIQLTASMRRLWCSELEMAQDEVA